MSAKISKELAKHRLEQAKESLEDAVLLYDLIGRRLYRKNLKILRADTKYLLFFIKIDENCNELGNRLSYLYNKRKGEENCNIQI